MSTKQPDGQPSIPFRYLRRNRKVYYPSDPRYYLQDETVLQWLGPDGEWHDVPTVEETKESDA